MRTAPFEPHPLFALPMPAEVAVFLARELHARGEGIGGVNGALPAARLGLSPACPNPRPSVSPWRGSWRWRA